MKKKVLYGVFMALISVLTMGSLQSCTDDLPGFKEQMADDLNKLDGVIASIRSEIAANKAACDANIANLQAQITANDGDIAALEANLASLAAQVADRVTYDELANDLTNLQNAMKAYSDAKDSELKTELEGKISDLVANLNITNARIDQLDGALQQLTSDCQTKFADFQNQLTTTANNLQSQINAINSSINTLQQDVANVWVELNNKQLQINAILAELANLDSKLESEIANLGASVDSQIEDLKKTIEANRESISKLTDMVIDLQKAFEEKSAELQGYIEDAFNEIQQTQTFVTQVYNALNDKIDEEVANLQDQIDTLQDGLWALEDQFDALVNRVQNLITSIVIQAADSPVFGTFNLPIGVQSNVLFNWYFENLGESYQFPNGASEYAYNAEKLIASPEDFAFAISCLKGSKYTLPAGYDEVNLGNLYVTLNPVGHNLTQGKTFHLETSLGEAGRLPYDITLVPSNEELYFGGSTRGLENGFYESKVTIPADPDMIASTKININDDLKATVETILNDRDITKRSALNLITAVWEQVNGTFPAYAVRADWAFKDMTSYSVLSKYELGVATAKPLSFKFLDGKGTSKKVPVISHFTNLFYTIKDEGTLHFDVSSFLDGVDYSIDLGTINIGTINVDIDMPALTVTIPAITIEVDGKSGTSDPTTATVTGYDQIAGAIETGLQNAISQINSQLGSQFATINTNLNNRIEDIVNDIMSKLDSKINGKIDSTLSKLGDKAEPWFKRLNKLVDIYNRVANKVNAFLANPNEYLQPAIFYKADGNIGIVSMASNDPTVFVNGGGEAFDLFPSTYTAELVAPAYKKFIACINVYNASHVALSNGRTIAQAVNNSAEDLATVLEGATYKIAVPTSAMTAPEGSTYEFLYQCVDYSGVTSTRKFYIKVK